MNNIQMLSQQSSLTEGAVLSGMQLPTVGARMAIAMVAMLPLLLIFPFIQGQLIKGVVIGGVKGKNEIGENYKREKTLKRVFSCLRVKQNIRRICMKKRSLIEALTIIQIMIFVGMCLFIVFESVILYQKSMKSLLAERSSMIINECHTIENRMDVVSQQTFEIFRSTIKNQENIWAGLHAMKICLIYRIFLKISGRNFFYTLIWIMFSHTARTAL